MVPLPGRAYIFIGLNAVRLLSIIGMLLVFASSIFVLNMDVRAYNDFMKNGADVDMTNCDYIETALSQPSCRYILGCRQPSAHSARNHHSHLSEVGWPMNFFNTFFPVLGSDFGLGPLGIFQGLISATILSHHVDDFTLVSAFFLFAISCINMFLGLIFRGKARVKRAFAFWEQKPERVLPKTFDLAKVPEFKKPRDSFVSKMFRTHGYSEEKTFDIEQRGSGFGTEGEKAAIRAAAFLHRPVEARPKYAPQVRSDSTLSGSTRSGTPVPEFKSSKIAI
ncbi:hypothetical protein QCA50_003660 [Cerrena zonata]|uniref:Uncharacterized protein n=1 Tax=Cerrena zonata TaxID=2478898 RepID=A0AAW0GSS5_9APHY